MRQWIKSNAKQRFTTGLLSQVKAGKIYPSELPKRNFVAGGDYYNFQGKKLLENTFLIFLVHLKAAIKAASKTIPVSQVAFKN